MVAIQKVRAANISLKNDISKQSMTAVFVGATSGIGRATLRSFAKHITRPTAIIIGRSQTAFASELSSLQTLNPHGTFHFLEADVSLIKNIDAVCAEIKAKLSGKHIDMLSTSQGYVGFAGRENNADGLDNSVSLRYYGRIRFAQNLLPLLSNDARVVSVLAGGQEGKIIEDDLDLEQNYSVGNAMNQFSTMHTLTFDALARENPEKAFLHVFPGLVSTGLLGRSATGVLGYIFRYVVDPILSLFAKRPEEIGERMLYYATSAQFATGSWALDWDGTPKEVEVLKEYRQRGFAEKVVEHNQRIFDRVLQH